MAPRSSTLAWKIPWTEEPLTLQSLGSLRVGQDWAASLSLFTFHFHALEKAMAAHSSVLAWRIPGTGEPGGLPSMGSHRVGHDWSDLAAAWCLFPFSLFGNHKSILYICEFVSVLLQSFTCLIFQFPHISDTIQCSSFCVWFILLSIIPSRSVFVVANFIFE